MLLYVKRYLVQFRTETLPVAFKAHRTDWARAVGIPDELEILDDRAGCLGLDRKTNFFTDDWTVDDEDAGHGAIRNEELRIMN